MPSTIEPMLATLASTPFDDPDWLYEIKWDGFRVQAVVDGGVVRTWTRSLKDAETYFPRLLSPASWIDARQAIVDGEVVAIDEDGRPDFSLLQTKLGQPGVGGLVYQPFDLLYLDGRLLLNVKLEDRKRLLRSVLRDHPRVRFAAHVEAEGVAFYEAARLNGLEGIIAKLRRSRYEPGRRSNAWLKLKVRPEQELVIGGWTPGEGNARDLGALAVGYYDDGKLRFAGKVGSGFTGAMRKDLLAKLRPLVVDDPPFDPPPPSDYKGRWGGDLGAVTWVRPELVMRAELGGWTRDGVVRQAAYKGLEPGRDATTVRRESAVATTSAVRAAEAETPAGADLGDDVAMPRTARTTKAAKTASTAKARPAKAAPTAKAADREGLEAHRGLPRAPGSRGSRCVACQRRGAGRPRRARQGGLVAGRWRRAQAHQPRQAAVRGRSTDHQARAHPLLRADRTDDAAPPRRPAAQPAAVPQRRRRARLLAEGHPGHRAGVADPLARDRRRRPRGPSGQRPPAGRSCGDAGLARQPGELRDPRLDRAPARAVAADVRLHRHRSRRGHDLGRDPGPGQAVPDRARASRRARLPEDDRQARHPDLDPGRARATASTRRAPGSSASRGPSGRPSRSSSPGSGRRARARAGPGSTTRRTRASRRSSRRTPSDPLRVRRCRRRSPGTSWTTRTCARTAGRSARSSSAWPSAATCSRPRRPTPRSCRRSEAATPASVPHGTIGTCMTTRSACGSPTPRRLRTWFRVLDAAFADEVSDAEYELERIQFEPDRVIGAVEGDAWVGAGAGYSLRLTVPGGVEVGAVGITAIGVMPSHRRRGILRQVMGWLVDQAGERGEPVAILWASETAIYQRFGFGIGTLQGTFDIERSRTRFAHPVEPLGRMRLVDRDEAIELIPPVYEAMRPRTPGAVSRPDVKWRHQLLGDAEWMRRGNGRKFIVVLEARGRGPWLRHLPGQDRVGRARPEQHDHRRSRSSGSTRRPSAPSGNGCSGSTWWATSRAGGRACRSRCCSSWPSLAGSGWPSAKACSCGSSTCPRRSRGAATTRPARSRSR